MGNARIAVAAMASKNGTAKRVPRESAARAAHDNCRANAKAVFEARLEPSEDIVVPCCSACATPARRSVVQLLRRPACSSTAAAATDPRCALLARARRSLRTAPGALRIRLLRWRDNYRALLERALSRHALRRAVLAAMVARRSWRFPWARYLPGLGQDYFPSVDGGQIRLHLRAPPHGDCASTRRRPCAIGSKDCPQHHPAKELDTIVDNIGVPYQRHQSDLLHLGAPSARATRHLRELASRPSSDR